MKKDDKISWVELWKNELNDADSIVFFNLQGVNANSVTIARKEFRDEGVRFSVIRNLLFKRAINGTSMEKVGDLLKGPNAIGVYNDPVKLAKISYAISRNYKFVIKGGYADGSVMSAADVIAISKILPREALLGMVLSTMDAPVRGFVSTLSAVLRNLIYAVKAIKDKKENN